MFGQSFRIPVRYRVGRQSPIGPPTRKPLKIFALESKKFGLSCTENPRVGSSILPLATNFNSMIFMRFPVSTGDAPGASIPTHGLSGFGWVSVALSDGGDTMFLKTPVRPNALPSIPYETSLDTSLNREYLDFTDA